MPIKLLSLFYILATAIMATLTLNKYRFTTERRFVYFFWIVFLVDVSGNILNLLGLKSFFVYNSLCVFYFVFLLHWYYRILELKKAVKVLSLIYSLLLVYVFYKQNYFEQNQTDGLVAGCIILLFCSLMYFYQILKSDKILNIKDSLPFWLTVGNIIYFVGILPIMLLQKYVGATNYTYSVALLIINFISYTFYILGFIWVKKKVKA